jgi:omega-amidase
LIFMANWPVKRIKAWELLLKARSIENMCYTIGVNRTGIDANKYSYSGNSLIIDYLGTEISNLPKNEIGVVSATIDRKNQEKIRKKLGFLNDMDSFTVTRSK